MDNKVVKKYECDKCHTISFRSYEKEEESYCKKCKEKEETKTGILHIKKGGGWADT